MLDHVPYLDGGIADSIPLIHAMEKGYRKNVVILTRNMGYRKKETGKEHSALCGCISALPGIFEHFI